MSTQSFPSLAGQGWNIERSPLWDTTIQENTSGMETRVANQSYPRYTWTITFNVLRQGSVHGQTFAEMLQLMGFYNQMKGSFDTFKYTDSDDSSVTSQAIGVGDGVTTGFQLVRTAGGFTEPVLAPNTVSAVYLNGVLQSAGNYSVSVWGATTPGIITFNTPPASLAAITADFSYYWPCRFDQDNLPLNKIMSGLYEGKSMTIKSVKN